MLGALGPLGRTSTCNRSANHQVWPRGLPHPGSSRHQPVGLMACHVFGDPATTPIKRGGSRIVAWPTSGAMIDKGVGRVRRCIVCVRHVRCNCVTIMPTLCYRTGASVALWQRACSMAHPAMTTLAIWAMPTVDYNVLGHPLHRL